MSSAQECSALSVGRCGAASFAGPPSRSRRDVTHWRTARTFAWNMWRRHTTDSVFRRIRDSFYDHKVDIKQLFIWMFVLMEKDTFFHKLHEGKVSRGKERTGKLKSVENGKAIEICKRTKTLWLRTAE